MRTLVGYAGGTTLDPTYIQIGDHTESVHLEYDPEVIAYEDLLDLYWDHVDGATPSCTQYAPIIFTHSEAQADVARISWKDHGADPEIEVREAEHFYPAEDYHQKYNLRRYDAVEGEFVRMYPDPMDLAESTAAARCNGILAGHASWEDVGEELEDYGLSEESVEELKLHLR